jgi:hypothetical protein
LTLGHIWADARTNVVFTTPKINNTQKKRETGNEQSIGNVQAIMGAAVDYRQFDHEEMVRKILILLNGKCLHKMSF